MTVAGDSRRSIELNGAELYYEEHGAGRPLVLLHAGFSSSATWDSRLPHLVDSFRVITPDSRGHGRSTNPGGELSYPLIADDVAALIEALELDAPLVGGYSDGGQVALELGTRHPGAAGGLIVGAAVPQFGPGIREFFTGFLGVDEAGTADPATLEVNLGDFAEVLKARHPGGEEQWRTLIQQSVPMWLEYQGLTPDQVSGIEPPTLVFAGDRDEMFSLDLITSLYRTLPNAELAIWPHADHFALASPEAASPIAAMIRSFAERHPARPISR